MTTVPNNVKHLVSNAKYHLEAANQFPPPVKDAAHILQLINGWENIILAEQELHAWAEGKHIDPKLRKDHEAKLDKVDQQSYVSRVIIGPPGNGIAAREVKYTSGKELKQLRQMCIFGLDEETNELSKLFSRGWHSDGLRNGLAQKIQWIELWIPLYESVN